MNAAAERNLVREALEHLGSSWLLEQWGQVSSRELEKELDNVRKALADFVTAFQRRFPDQPPPDPYDFARANPLKAAAFFQLDTLRTSPQMKVMIWRIFQGADLLRAEFEYTLDEPLALSITLRSKSGETEVYQACCTWDYHVLRHFGLAGSDGTMVLRGFYPLK